MEPWITVIVAAIVAFSTLGATFLQSCFSNKRFKIELGRAIDVEVRKRRWEVRSKPLLALRSELAVMASKLEKLAKSGNSFTVPNKTEEQLNEALNEAVKDWNNYVSGDHLEKVLYSQANAEIVDFVREIRNKYLETYDNVVMYKKELSAVEFGKAARAAENELRPLIAAVQELINKKLEAL